MKKILVKDDLRRFLKSSKNHRLIKISNEIHKKAYDLSLELSIIEGRRVPMREVLERPILDMRVIEELKLGSKKRRLGLK